MNESAVRKKIEPPAADEVHVWLAHWPDWIGKQHTLAATLSVAESERARRFFQEVDRQRYVCAHGLLRGLLGRYLARSPSELTFCVNEHGKPALANGSDGLTFNLSHSGSMLLFGFACGQEVGVDVEMIREDLDCLEIARREFSEREYAALEQEADAGARREAFFRGWTRKEAYLKARGTGLGHPLRDFAVTISASEVPGVLWAADDPQVAARWSMWGLTDVAGYAGAVVCAGRPVRFVDRRCELLPLLTGG